ncbi:MAG: YfcE family phosphodiesterase [Caldilineaceae bacterium]|nr:YfcE family phosphodiesterase [Caldilineaceae bacterium]
MTKIAIMSDSHDQVENLAKALEAAQAHGANVLLHCGDLCAPFNIDRLAQGFAGPIHIVFGNNDGDGRLLQMLAAKHDHVHLHAIYIEQEIAGRHIAMIHYPEPALRIAQSGQMDLVCYGHNHTKHCQQLDNCWLVNPGEILGLQGAPTWALYDCATHQAELIAL